MARVSLVLGGLLVGLPQSTSAQLATELSPQVRDRYVRVSAPALVIQNVTLVDGTGEEPRRGMSVVVEEGRITEVGQRVSIPPDAEILGYSGHTLIPGLVGLHDHMFYTAAGGRVATLSFSGPRLYLGGGVTTIRTTGSIAPYAEINVKAEIDAGRMPGPRMHITAPYITSGRPDPAFPDMTLLHSPEQARRFVAYWGEEGATWLKVYTNIGRAEFMAAVDEAHKARMAVTGHLCSLTHGEAAELGVDNVEHGLLTATDYNPAKQGDRCPLGNEAVAGSVDVRSPEVEAVFRKMIDEGVAMTSTLPYWELFVPDRPIRDSRSLEAMSDGVREAYLAERDRIDSDPNPLVTREYFRNAQAYELRFVEMGGLLAAGVDPTGNGGALPGYGDQRGIELLVEAEFTFSQAIQIASLNGARVLGVDDELGSIEPGKIADMVLLRGDLAGDPSIIRNTVLVFKDGVGYDSRALLEEARGWVGIR